LTNPQPYHPPRWVKRFFYWYCKPDLYEDIMGDLEEEAFARFQTGSSKKANWWFMIQVIALFKPRFIKPIFNFSISKTQNTMFRNNLKIGFRNIKKYKSSSAINIAGLSIGMACFILISFFIKDEVSYDQHFTDVDLIYRVTVKNYDLDGEVSRQWAFASAGHAERLKEDYAQITHANRFFPWAFPDLRREDKFFPGEQVIFTDADVFDIFDFEFIQGSPASALEDLYSLVLTESSAIRLFGNDWHQQSIIGQNIELSRDGMKAPFKVTGVMKDMPDQQHFHFEYLAPIRFVAQIMGEDAMNNVGGNYNWLTYIKVAPETDTEWLTTTINEQFWDKYIGAFDSGAEARDFYDFDFQAISDIHLNSNLEGEIEPNGSLQQVKIFTVIGILILLTAIVNYMNLSTSHYSRRMKEVGVRKSVGANRTTLINQFLTESILISFIAFPIALLFAWVALPMLNDFVDKQLSFDLLENANILLSLVALLLFVGITAGFYPALLLSKINTIKALKGEQVMRGKRWNFRSVLVTFQYVVVIGLIFALLIVEGQLRFIRKTNPGYQKEQLVNLNLTRNIQNLDVFRQELITHPGISDVSFSSRIPTGRLADSWGAGFHQGDSLAPLSFRLPFITADERFIETFEIPLIAGTNFSQNQDMAEDSVGYYLINRAAAEALGFVDVKEIIGKPLSYGPFDGKTFRMGKILGVIENFHFESLHSEIVPLLMLKMDNRYRQAVIKINPGDIKSTLSHIESTFTSFDPINTVNYRFVDELFENQYLQEQRLSTMIQVFTGIAIFIGCLGLIGMVGFIIETRTKEIGIRKVLGASGNSILNLIVKRFIALIVIAFIIISPIAYWLMKGWLDNFVYRMNIGALEIIIPLISAVLITLVVTLYQTIKAAQINPVYCLKDE
jgi:putative ABC transport system permease protein